MLPKNASLRHVALAVYKLDECEQFYNSLGLRTELKTDDYVYLTGNGDNISLHKVHAPFEATQRLEHIGFALDSIQVVDQLTTNKQRPRAKQFYERLGFIATHEGMKFFWADK